MNSTPKKVLIVSTFPPKRCGIGTYAHEQMLWYKRRNWVVYQQAPDSECSAHFRIGLGNVRGLLKFWLNCWYYNFDEISLHYLDDFMFPCGSRNLPKRLLIRLTQLFVFTSLLVLWGNRFQIIFHEIDERNPNRFFHLLRALVFSCASNLQFHTTAEQGAFLSSFRGWVRAEQSSVVEHGRFMFPKYHGSRPQARLELNVRQEKKVFLCIGFIQRHKCFKEVVSTFQRIAPMGSELYIVGSARVPVPEITRYRDELRELCSNTPETVHFVEDFVDDVAFDRWLKAADVVILPYEEIWSSGVGARTKLLGTKLWIRSHPNLLSQFSRDQVELFASWDDLGSLFSAKSESLVSLGNDLIHQGSIKSATFDASLHGKSILFVMPWFGGFAKGGAERVILDLCQSLSSEVVKVTCWTTQTTTLESWNNSASAVEDETLGFAVRRFWVRTQSEPWFKFLNGRLNEGKLGLIGSELWKRSSLRGIGMRQALEQSHQDFDAIIICHYLGGTSHELAGVCPNKTLVYPFIHDEPALYNRVMRDLFASVRGVICNSASEVELASKAEIGLSPQLFSPIGNIVEASYQGTTEPSDRLVEFAQKPYVLFLGRLIEEKNLKELLEWHSAVEAALGAPAPMLVCAGVGAFFEGLERTPWLRVLGLISESEKRWLLRNCLCLVQPSLLESFSLVVMEAWANGRPVCVHAKCLTTHGHVEISGGGAAVAHAADYVNFILELLEFPARAAEKAQMGRAYVEREFSRSSVVHKFSSSLSRFLEWA